MTITTLSRHEFIEDISRATKAAADGPVFINDQERPAYVLLTIEDYRKLSGQHESIVDLLSYPGAGDIDFDPPRMNLVLKPADFS